MSCGRGASSASGSSPSTADAEAIEERLRRRNPGTPEELLAGGPLLAEHVDEAHLRANSRDEADYQFLRSLAERSHIRVPLRSRGRNVGTLSLLAITHVYTPADLQLSELLAGRVGLALDNAGLFADLEILQRQLTTALDTLAEAITIQNDRGTLIYANDAAAAALGFATGAELMATPLREIVDAYESFNEDGSPLRLDQLPGRQVIEGATPEPLLVRAVNRRTGEERWRMVKATAVPVREGEPRLAVNVIEDITDVKRAELAQRFLADVSAVLADALDYEPTLAKIAQLSVPRLADWCGVTMPDEGGRLRSVAVAHSDPGKVEFARAYEGRYPTDANAPTGPAQVMRDGSSQLINGITEELLDATIEDPERRAALATVGMKAVMMVPMIAGGRGIGVISFVSAESGRRFGEADLELAEELGRRAGTAVENARLYRERSHIAATLQRGLLPEQLPTIDGLRLASLYRPAGEENLVGGDFYDAFATADGLDAARRRRHRSRGGGGRAHGPGPPHAPHRGHAARRSRRRARPAQPGARPARRADAVHRRARAPRRPTRGRRRCSAPATRSRCSSATVRCARSDTSARCSAPGPTASGRLIASRCSKVTCWCSTATASRTPWEPTSASATSGCSRRCAASPMPSRRSRPSTPRSTSSSAAARRTTPPCSL